MKKILFFISILTIACLMLSSAIAAARQENGGNNKIAILLAGSNAFKSTHYFAMTEEQFSKNNPLAGQIALGIDVQSKYLEYWLDKGFLEEQQPSTEDLLALPAYLDKDKVLVMIVKDPAVEKNTAFTLAASGEKSRASIQIDAFLVDREKIIQRQTASNEDDSFYSELRAKRGAFKKCLKELSSAMLPLF